MDTLIPLGCLRSIYPSRSDEPTVVRSEIIANGVDVESVRAAGLADGYLLVPTGPGVREAKNRRTEIIVHSGRPDTD
jgi:flagellar motor protein MotB